MTSTRKKRPSLYVFFNVKTSNKLVKQLNSFYTTCEPVFFSPVQSDSVFPFFLQTNSLEDQLALKTKLAKELQQEVVFIVCILWVVTAQHYYDCE